MLGRVIGGPQTARARASQAAALAPLFPAFNGVIISLDCTLLDNEALSDESPGAEAAGAAAPQPRHMIPRAWHCTACGASVCKVLRMGLLSLFDGKADIVDLVLQHYELSTGAALVRNLIFEVAADILPSRAIHTPPPQEPKDQCSLSPFEFPRSCGQVMRARARTHTHTHRYLS